MILKHNHDNINERVINTRLSSYWSYCDRLCGIVHKSFRCLHERARAREREKIAENWLLIEARAAIKKRNEEEEVISCVWALAWLVFDDYGSHCY
jgi:hypothetical protein